jgi:hypothetical protein
MTQEEITTKDEYQDKIAFHAECMANEFRNEDEIVYQISLTVDCDMIDLHAHYNDAIKTLQLSDKEPRDYVLESIDGSMSYQEILQNMAFDVIRQDLYAEVRDNTELEV